MTTPVRPRRRAFSNKYTIGFEFRVPVDQAVLKLEPNEQDEWAAQQIRSFGYRPQIFCHVDKIYEGSMVPVAFTITTYRYKKEGMAAFSKNKKGPTQ